MITALRVEYAKLRRTRTLTITALMVAAVTAFSSMQLFARDHVARINEPLTAHWAGLLVSHAMTQSMMAPVFLAVLASRIVDPEHQGNGWLRASINGWPRGQLCLVKVIALAPLLVGATAMEMGSLIALSRLRGATTPVPYTAWGWYAAASIIVSLFLLAGSIWLAARIDSQLVVLGVGVLGGFIGVFSLLMPPWLAPLTPWGYFAVALPFTMKPLGDGAATFVPLDPPLLVIATAMAAASLFLWLALRRLDRHEG